MRLPVTVFLLLSILLGSLSKTWVYSHYRLNYELYSKVLCVNKDKPKMDCHGKCQLKKEMNQQDQKENASLPKESISDLYFNNAQTPFLPFHWMESVWQKQPIPSLLLGQVLSVFQPPEI
jgi:hypothetical protein